MFYSHSNEDTFKAEGGPNAARNLTADWDCVKVLFSCHKNTGKIFWISQTYSHLSVGLKILKGETAALNAVLPEKVWNVIL